MNRRQAALALSGLGAASLRSHAQQTQKVPVIGFLHPGFPGIAGTNPAAEATRNSLRREGFVDGETVKIEYRWGHGKPENLPGLAAELVRIKADAILAIGGAAVHATKAATGAMADPIPIIAADLESDPVASGFVANLARPRGNITGLFLDQAGMANKWLQLMQEVVPAMQRVAVLWDVNSGPYQRDAIIAAGHAQSINLRILEFRDSAGLETVINLGMKDRPQAIVQLSSPLISQLGKPIADVLALHRLPGISPFREFATGGGLMSYGPNRTLFFGRLGPYISRLVKGAKAGELPVEQPTHFEFIVNLKTAKMLGIKFPLAILTRADEIVE